MMVPVLRWFLSLPASMFYCMAVSSMHQTLGSPNGNPAFAVLMASLLFPGSIALWVLADARRRGYVLSYDAGGFFFFAWPVLAPIYLISTRGWRGFATLGCFVMLYLAAGLFGSILSSLLVTHR